MFSKHIGELFCSKDLTISNSKDEKCGNEYNKQHDQGETRHDNTHVLLSALFNVEHMHFITFWSLQFS